MTYKVNVEAGGQAAPVATAPTDVDTHAASMVRTLDAADSVLSTIAGVASLGLLNPAVGGIAVLLDRVLKIARTAVAAHEAISGEPLDLGRLHHIDLV